MKICVQAVPDIINGYNKCVALEPFGAQRLIWTKPEVSISSTLDEKGLLVRGKINEIKVNSTLLQTTVFQAYRKPMPRNLK